MTALGVLIDRELGLIERAVLELREIYPHPPPDLHLVGSEDGEPS